MEWAELAEAAAPRGFEAMAIHAGDAAQSPIAQRVLPCVPIHNVVCANANPAFFAIMAGAEFDGWLTVGITGGDTAGALSSIGLDFDGWTASSGLSTDNGAVFWMSPDDGPTGEAVVAQITVTGGFTASVNAQGRSNSGDDYKVVGVTFSA